VSSGAGRASSAERLVPVRELREDVVVPTLLIADADGDFRRTTRGALEERGFDVLAEAASAADAVDRAAAQQPDLCLVDLRLPGGGLGAVAKIAKAVPQTAVVVLADSDDKADVLAAFERGASGFLPKEIGANELAVSLRAAANGEPAISRALVPLLVSQVRRGTRRQLTLPSGAVVLTAREWDVGELLRDGHPTREIAARLGVSPVTVRRHVGLLMKKFGATDRDAVVEALRSHAR
jgi:two-component system NarL family response regulator